MRYDGNARVFEPHMRVKFKFPVPVPQKSAEFNIIIRDKMIFTTGRENSEQMILFGNLNNSCTYIHTIHRFSLSYRRCTMH